MDSDDQAFDSEEETEKLEVEAYEAQKRIQGVDAVDEVSFIEALNGAPDLAQEECQTIDDPAPQGSLEIKILEAAENGILDEVKQLLKEHPELVGAQDADGYSPLHRACYSDHVAIAEFLLKNGADVHKKTCDGWTPLHSACKWNHANCASLLLDYGSDINALTNGGQTPLHLAASNPEAKETIFLLISNPKISVNIRNQTGETAYDIAHRHCKYYKLFEICDPCFNII